MELELLLGLLLCYSQLSGVFSNFLSTIHCHLRVVTFIQGPDPRWMKPIRGFQGRDRDPVYSRDEGVGAFGAVLCMVLGLGAQCPSCVCGPGALWDATQVPNIQYGGGHGFGQKSNGPHVSTCMAQS